MLTSKENINIIKPFKLEFDVNRHSNSKYFSQTSAQVRDDDVLFAVASETLPTRRHHMTIADHENGLVWPFDRVVLLFTILHNHTDDEEIRVFVSNLGFA